MGKVGWIVVGALVVIALLLVGSAVLFSSTWGRGYGYGMTQAPAPWAGVGSWSPGGWGMMGMMFLGPLFLLIVIGLFVGAIVWAVQAGSRGGSSAPASPPAEAPLDILKRRYASGELTKQQFDEMRQALGQT
jgi:putative membrane protein